MVNLITTLAHASGEWIASDWPVCPIAETANPQRMGAALTYARRYALFTLVGIAGEDDLDAPDLCDGSLSPSVVHRSFKSKDGEPHVPLRTPGNGHGRAGIKGDRVVTLDPEQSAALREKLLTELGNIASADLAWLGRVRRSPPRTASRRPMPSSWRTRLSGGYRNSHHLMRLHFRRVSLRWLRFPSGR